MKSFAINTLIFAVALSAVFLTLTSKTYAANAKCYNNLAPGGGLVNCNDPAGAFAQKAAVQGLTFEANKCYEFVKFGTGIVVGFADCNSNPIFKQASPTTDLSLPKTVKNDCDDANLNESNCGIIRYLVVFINLLSALVGVVVVAMIIIGGIQYSSAGDDPQKVAAAKSKISNALLALVAFIFTYAFLQWLVPGGLF